MTSTTTAETIRPERNIPAEIARSWLLVNAMKTELFDQSAVSRADSIILDIEDAVDPSQKDAARDNVVNWLTAGGSAWVRINDATSPFWADDLAGPARHPRPARRHAGQDRIGGPGHRELPPDGRQDARSSRSSSPPLGIEEANHIAKAQGAFRLAFGSGDFRRDTGMAATPEAMAYPRAKLVVASRVGNLPGPIDGPTVGTNHPILREQTGITVMMGMTGKLCLAIDQTPVINEVISPTPSDVAWATDFMADFEANGRVIRDGSDLPRLGRAEKIMKLAVAFGVQPAL